MVHHKLRLRHRTHGRVYHWRPPSSRTERHQDRAAATENITSSSKPEIQQVLRRFRGSAEPRQQAACTGNLVQFGRVVSEICVRTDRQTDRHGHQSIYCGRLSGRSKIITQRRSSSVGARLFGCWIQRLLMVRSC